MIAFVCDVNISYVARSVFVNFKDQIDDSWLLDKMRHGVNGGKEMSFFTVITEHPAHIFSQRISAIILIWMQFRFTLQAIRGDCGIAFIADLADFIATSFRDHKVQIDVRAIF